MEIGAFNTFLDLVGFIWVWWWVMGIFSIIREKEFKGKKKNLTYVRKQYTKHIQLNFFR